MADEGTEYELYCFAEDVRESAREPLLARIARLEAAIAGIAPWLSASLNEPHGQAYEDACNAVFACDSEC